jgi:hypothetical protein
MRRETEIDHIDPRWKEGRDYQLVCGLDCPPNYREEDWKRNTAKSNRFLPWRWCRDELGVVPEEPGDLSWFLVGADIEKDIPGEWVLMEFLSEEWFEASKGSFGAAVAKTGIDGTAAVLKQWETFRSNPEMLDKRNRKIGDTMLKLREDSEFAEWSTSRMIEGHRKHREEHPEVWDKVDAESSERLKKRWEEDKESMVAVAVAGGKVAGNMKFQCLETGKVLGPGPLTQYQRARNIDTSKRRRVS